MPDTSCERGSDEGKDDYKKADDREVAPVVGELLQESEGEGGA